MSDDITKQIETLLREATKRNIKLKEKLNDNEKEVADLTRARMCIHDWKDTGAFMYATYECRKCGFKFMDS